MKKPNIALDGYSSTGKSSISKIIADRLGYIHLDTGALYRGITWYALENCSTNDEIALVQLFSHLEKLPLAYNIVHNKAIITLEGKNIEQEIRLPKVAHHVSNIAKQKEVRAFTLDYLKNLAKRGGIIMDGRDIGTVVLPHAEYKFFLTASIEERTRRRHLELLENGIEISKEEIRENLIARDKIDSERAIAPLKKADDAIEIDNTHLNKEQTIEKILSYIKI